jgi:predicted NAD/FAD-binding protein
MNTQRIAVIGAGISGIVAAHCLSRLHKVVLFEARDRLGGHTNTITLGEEFGQDQGLPVDTGFIVFNDRTYPTFIRFLSQLGIQGAPTDMSFSFSDQSRNFSYAGTGLSGLLARRKNILDPGYWAFLVSIVRFNKRAAQDLAAGSLEGLTLEEYLNRVSAPQRLRRDYLGPMGKAIWSASEAEAMGYPAESFVSFFANHGLLSRPGSVPWRYIKGGSRTYVQAFQSGFSGEIRLGLPIRSVERPPDGPVIRHDDGEERFDAVVLASHADQSLAMLADADELERTALSPWRYSSNHTVLHCDRRHMPGLRRAWACWNVLQQAGDGRRRPVRVTYWMNRLQRLDAARDWLVSLNTDSPFAPGSQAYATVYEHPVYSLESLQAQKLLPDISGRRQTFFCGSYHGYGFHEDGARSAANMAEKHFGASL